MLHEYCKSGQCSTRLPLLCVYNKCAAHAVIRHFEPRLGHCSEVSETCIIYKIPYRVREYIIPEVP